MAKQYKRKARSKPPAGKNTSDSWRKYFIETDYLPGSLMCILLDKGSELCSKNGVTFAPWNSTFRLNKLLTKTTEEPYFRDYWANRMVDEFSLMVWNCVYKRKRKEMHDRKAIKLADQVTEKFCRSFS